MINTYSIHLDLTEVLLQGQSNIFILFRILVLTTSLDDMFKGRSETEDMDKFIPKFGWNRNSNSSKNFLKRSFYAEREIISLNKFDSYEPVCDGFWFCFFDKIEL